MSAISVRKLTKKYGRFIALDQVDLEVDEGKLFALVGPNGAGKTTLMRILTGQLDSNGGEAYVLGKNVAIEQNEVKQRIGYVPQEMSVWTDISGYENLLIYSKIYGLPIQNRAKIINDALELMDLENVKDRLTSTYSGGMIRKLEIASAVMLRPKVLFLDEPTIGLDPTARKIVWEKLKRLNKENGISVFFTTHYMDEADIYADNMAIINCGKVVKTGTPLVLKNSVGNDCIIFEVAKVPGAQEIEDLKSVEDIVDITCEGSSLKIYVADADRMIEGVIAEILKLRIQVMEIRVHKPTLYDAFLKYAGIQMDQGRGTLEELKKTRKRIGGS